MRTAAGELSEKFLSVFGWSSSTPNAKWPRYQGCGSATPLSSNIITLFDSPISEFGSACPRVRRSYRTENFVSHTIEPISFLNYVFFCCRCRLKLIFVFANFHLVNLPAIVSPALVSIHWEYEYVAAEKKEDGDPKSRPPVSLSLISCELRSA